MDWPSRFQLFIGVYMPYYRHKKTGEIIKWTLDHFKTASKEYEFAANTQRELAATPPVKKSVRKKRGKS